MKRTAFYLVILSMTAVPVGARTVELTFYPAKAPEPAQKYQLLPKAEQQADADAAPLYKKATQSLPKNFQTEQISQWLKTPPDKLPHRLVQSTLRQFKPTLELLEEARKCRRCAWPYWDDDALSQNLRGYRMVAFFLALQVRFEIAQGRYDKAIGTVQTGLAMAKHLSEAPTLVQDLVGLAVSEFLCRQLEQFVQRPDAPNLYLALRDLPQPVIDLTEQLEWEDPDIKEKVRLQMNRLDRRVALLQCIEALRLHAGAHNGKFPNKLNDVTEVNIPDDPVTRKQFVYSRSASKAVLETPGAKGATDKYALRYELSRKE
ncbi:MAG: hypothetical protein ACYSYV_11200 [Planctomycetota bacterium]